MIVFLVNVQTSLRLNPIATRTAARTPPAVQNGYQISAGHTFEGFMRWSVGSEGRVKACRINQPMTISLANHKVSQHTAKNNPGRGPYSRRSSRRQPPSPIEKGSNEIIGSGGVLTPFALSSPIVPFNIATPGGSANQPGRSRRSSDSQRNASAFESNGPRKRSLPPAAKSTTHLPPVMFRKARMPPKPATSGGS